MTAFLTTLVHLAPVLAVVALMFAGALLTLPPIGRWSDDRTYDPRLIYGPTDPIAADESVAAVLGWHDPFKTTRRQIAALPTREIA